MSTHDWLPLFPLTIVPKRHADNRGWFSEIFQSNRLRDLGIGCTFIQDNLSRSTRRGIPLIYVSTDYVFDGRKGAPYVESDSTAPPNAYGHSKLAGERSVSAANRRHVILRTAWLYSPHGTNFVKTILRLAQEREHLTVVADRRGCPTSARNVAQACLDIALLCAAEPDRSDYGIYLFAGAGAATWFEFANAVIDQSVHRLGNLARVEPISTDQYPTVAARPADSRLDCAAILEAFGLTPRPWRLALAETIDCLLARRSFA